MHGEELVVELVVDDLLVRVRQLRTHQQRHDAADQEEAERRAQVELADQLVVGRGENADDLLAQGVGLPGAVPASGPFAVAVPGSGMGVSGGAHLHSPFSGSLSGICCPASSPTIVSAYVGPQAGPML